MTLAGDAVLTHLGHLLRGDTESDRLIAGLAEAAGATVDRARRAALGTEDLRPGQLLWDAAVSEDWGLPWTAQLSGADLPARRSDESLQDYLLRARDAIVHVQGWHRGSPEARRAAARARLTGTRAVTLVERYQGSPWRELVVTYSSQTPDPAGTLADLTDQAAAVAGVRTIYRTDQSLSYAQAQSQFRWYGDAEAAFDTYAAAESQVLTD